MLWIVFAIFDRTIGERKSYARKGEIRHVNVRRMKWTIKRMAPGLVQFTYLGVYSVFCALFNLLYIYFLVSSVLSVCITLNGDKSEEQRAEIHDFLTICFRYRTLVIHECVSKAA